MVATWPSEEDDSLKDLKIFNPSHKLNVGQKHRLLLKNTKKGSGHSHPGWQVKTQKSHEFKI
jgi:hypothetical protein